MLKNDFSYINLLCLVTTEQDQELDDLSASVETLGGVGLTTHEELMGQVNFLGHICSLVINVQYCDLMNSSD